MSSDLSAILPSIDTANTATFNTAAASRPTSCRVGYVSGPCGAGKTYAAAQDIDEIIHQRPTGAQPNFLYVAPSIRLLNEFATLLNSLGIDHRIISSNTDPKAVTKELMKHLKFFDGGGHVTICTHVAFFNLPYFPKRDQWTIVIDEIPQIDHYLSFAVPRSGSQFAQWFEAKPFNEHLSVITPRRKNQIDKLIEEDDVATNPFKDLFRKCRSENYIIFTDSESYDRVVHRRRDRIGEQGSVSQKGRVHFLAMLKPEALHKTTILGANVESSMLYDWLKRNLCQVIEASTIKDRLRYSEYDRSIGERTKIYYCLEDQVYSKSLRGQADIEGRPIKEAMDETILNFIGDRRCLLFANRDDEGGLVRGKNVTLLPGSVGGLNCYDDHDLLVFIAALNRSPVHLRMLGYLGFSQSIIRQSTFIEQVHQSVMRTSLRRSDSSVPVEIIVPDRSTAQAVGKIIGCQNIKRLGNIEVQQSVKKAKPYTKAEKDLRYNLKKAKSALFSGQQELRPSSLLKEKSRINHKEDTISLAIPKNTRATKAKKTTAPQSPNEQRLLLTCHEIIETNRSEDHGIKGYGPTELMKWLRRCSRVSVDEKTEVYLFNTAVFEPITDPVRYRTKSNFKQSWCAGSR